MVEGAKATLGHCRLPPKHMHTSWRIACNLLKKAKNIDIWHALKGLLGPFSIFNLSLLVRLKIYKNALGKTGYIVQQCTYPAFLLVVNCGPRVPPADQMLYGSKPLQYPSVRPSLSLLTRLPEEMNHFQW